MPQEPKWLVRLISCYDKETELLVSRHALPRIDLGLLQEYWGLPATEPMIDMFDINEVQAKFLCDIDSDLYFDFSKFDYFISAITTDLDQSKADGGFMGHYPPPESLPAFPDAQPDTPKTDVKWDVSQ